MPSSSNTGSNPHPEDAAGGGMHHVQSISGVAEFGAAAAALSSNNNLKQELLEQQQQNEEQQSEEALTSSSTNNAASWSAGARILFATDDWFARAENLLRDEEPAFDPDAFCREGKVMDGWETRRRREAGHDWCLVRLAQRTALRDISIDTAHFTGNQTPKISLELCDLEPHQESSLVKALPGAVERVLCGGVQGTGMTPSQVAKAEAACRAGSIEWTELLCESELAPGYQDSRHHEYSVVVDGTTTSGSSSSMAAAVTGTHVRVNYYPDGGVARLRLRGVPAPLPVVRPAQYTPIVTGRTCTVVPHTSGLPLPSVTATAAIDEEQEQPLTELSVGGVGLVCSNQHYGEPSLLLQAVSGRDMGDGWETARHPHRPAVVRKTTTTTTSGNGLTDSDLSDWAVLQLAVPGTVQRVILDTKHFRGNYPESVLVEGCSETESNATAAATTNDWFPLVPRGRMAPDAEHVYEYTAEQQQQQQQLLNADRLVRLVRVTIFPDGGLSRVRVYGTPCASSS